MAALGSGDESMQSIQELAETVINCIRFSTQSLIRMYVKSNFFENEQTIIVHVGYTMNHDEYEFCACLINLPQCFFDKHDMSTAHVLSESGDAFLNELKSISQSIVSGLFVRENASVKVKILEDCSCDKQAT